MTGNEAKKLNRNMRAIFVTIRRNHNWYMGSMTACVVVMLCSYIAAFIYDSINAWMLSQAVVLASVSIFSVIQHRLLRDELDIAYNTVTLSHWLSDDLATTIEKLDSVLKSGQMAAGNTSIPMPADCENSEASN